MGSYLSRQASVPTAEHGSENSGVMFDQFPSSNQETVLEDRAPLVCANCLAPASWSRQVFLCNRCNFPFCAECMGAGSQQIKRPPTQHGAHSRGEHGNLANERSMPLCPSCRSSLLRLPDDLLRYIMLFLSYRNQDRILSVCTRFSSVVWLPYDYLKNLEDLLQWREPFDVLHVSPHSVVLRCAIRGNGETLAVKLVPKNRLLSRRLWQRMQDYLDIRIGFNYYRHKLPATLASSSPFPTVSRVFHNHDLVCIGSAFVDPAKYVPLSDCLQFSIGQGNRGRAARVWGERTCLCILRKIVDAIGWMHGSLGAVHRNLSLDSIHVDLGNGGGGDRDSVCEVRILGLSHARFTGPRSRRPKFSNFPQQLDDPDKGGGRRASPTGSCDSINDSVAGSINVATAAFPTSRQPFPLPSSIPLPPPGSSAVATPLKKKTVRPLLLPLSTGRPMPRSAAVYGRVAKEREAVLTSGNAAQRFIRPAFYTRQLLSSPHPLVFGAGSTASLGDIGRLQPRTPAPTEEGTKPAIFEDSDSEEGELLVGTPRSAPGFAAPELLPALAAKSILPSTGASAEDMQARDVFAIGGVWYHMLSALVREQESREAPDSTVLGLPPLAPLEKLQAAVSAGSWELLLGLLHVDPQKRWTCRHAMSFVDDLLQVRTPV